MYGELMSVSTSTSFISVTRESLFLCHTPADPSPPSLPPPLSPPPPPPPPFPFPGAGVVPLAGVPEETLSEVELIMLEIGLEREGQEGFTVAHSKSLKELYVSQM